MVSRAARSTIGSVVLAASTALSLTACGSGGGDGTTDPGPTPTAIRADAGNQQTGVAGVALATALTVVVTDKDNKPVASRRVEWNVGAGSGSVTPTVSTTNSSGVATALWTLGTTAGTARLTAQVSGLNPVVFSATVLAGPAAVVVATPDVAYIGVGDTLRVRGTVRDQYGNPLTGQEVTFSSLESGIASVNTTGLVTALAQGAARIVVTGGTRADTVPVTVGPAGASVCGLVAPRLLALGEVYIPPAGTNGVSACISGLNLTGAEYALTLISTSTNFGVATTLDVVGLGTNVPQFAALTDVSASSGSTLLDAQSSAAVHATTDANADAELRRSLIAQRELTPLVGDARAWHADRAAFGRTALLADLAVGDAIRLNVNSNMGCSAPDMRNGRVAAVGQRAVIVTDTDNPTGGYTDAEYAGILATFDTLVYPMDTSAFGAPSNISQYGKIILFYTRAVNALTPQGAGYTIGGFFFARDLYPKTARNGLQACAASNENEMFYMLVPDPNATINGNRRTKDEVTLLNLATIAHELQHLINASRRLYVNTGATPNELTWLDEGLSHIAEELLFFRVAGFSSRQNINLNDISVTTLRSEQFRNYASQNFSRFYNFLIAPETNSPYAPNDSLSTRGAIWNFLRYAAGRQGANGEAGFLRALVNSNTTGVANLQGVLSGNQFADYLRDWTVALIADDYTAATTTALASSYIIPAWNFRSIYPGLRFSGGAALGVYPIATRSLRSNVPQRVLLAGGTSSYLRFSLPLGGNAFISWSSNGGVPASTMRWAVVRIR
ncbi:Ig-like domain-containing protein [Gemmatimonas sp.]|uniref:Ig-like domain-containing protein n=1 Tax=Gemmatimonas sp. TaxID=1962908 RepID=UPI002ED8AE56